jgi:hypothetical protein
MEVTLILPLGVVANHLMKLEADLRLLNMKALDFTQAYEGGRDTRLIQAQIEDIYEALDSIRSLVSTIEADIHPWSAGSAQATTQGSGFQVGTHLAREDDTLSSPEIHSKSSARKLRPEQDD